MEALFSLDLSYYLLVSLGVLIGIIFGAIPGMTATMAVAVCLPMTYALDLNHGLALLLGLYVGGISGGLVPAILINIPGTPSSITTTFDGYPMTLKGEPEKALKIGIVSSLVGGLFSAAVLYYFAPTLADWAIKFSYVEKFLIILFALTVIASLCTRLLVGIFSGVLGVWVSLFGVYDMAKGGNGELRIVPEVLSVFLENGFSLLPVLIGLFGLTVIFGEAEKGVHDEATTSVKLSKDKRFSWSVFKGQTINLLRSSTIGTFIGLLPGVGGSAASVLAYSQAKNFSDDPSKFGTGHPDGVIASESSNNGLTGGALIPLLSLGIPGDSTTAVLIGAFTLQGIQVGPLFIAEHTDVWNTMMLGLVVANLIMFAIMYYAIRHISKVIMIPKYLLYPGIMMMCVVGAYAINSGIMFDVWTLFLFGLIGWIGVKLGLEIAPFIIGFILGPSAEVYFVKSLESFGTLAIFFTKSPIALFLWGLIALSVGYSVYSTMKAKRASAKDTV
ncbi:tripartite tricarboxylate transporter permease [Azoarcus sp. L1K30]|uniref:tripartite tricarboxylate transporter permease n=1 Tax=Azoarcus sp. L1K30 TaxID=2820277 RepID=UPI001B82B9E8|nr:tripartite tricarboxylate transporter permease [Azoarcus sp. L1K30]MBR0567564.1 tripartite tricarboxylate transporter permease [Azoarcus sp. L1K30]